jgi:NAD(P)-dependent dehydrogenase (short-subunit alcohol dehydrogenase family)
VVNNAMDMSLEAPILKTSVSQLDRQYEIAVRGALLAIQLFVPGMQARHHGVVTYLSTLFHYPFGPSNYCAVKAATESMMISLAAESGPVKDSGVAVFTYIPGFVRRFRPDDVLHIESFKAPPAMPGYPGPYPPEDCGAALAYSIVHAAEIHGSGINIQQALNRMDWSFPKPETLPAKDYDRLSDQITVRMFGFIGAGFSGPKRPLTSINRSESQLPAGWDKPEHA